MASVKVILIKIKEKLMSKSIKLHILVQDEDSAIHPVRYYDVLEAVKEFEGEDGDNALLDVIRQIKDINYDINVYIANKAASLSNSTIGVE
jgi:hypothetical protein